ncbi:Lsr2 family protein [uncultured Tessaracoccus sp.]|uniref:histone-like nucleoid-structuring protein Lsr2 n=1 Tax=uncultured Tessaracoccus sp. TaxID=905023 RepID=UPI0026272F9B|nr:Lsr2 family protein [uncultured Tessaracoccus sp.]
MARKVEVTLVDDIDGGVATATVQFAFDGVQYEIDLNDDNTAKFEKALAPYIEHGRKVSATRRRGRKAAAAGGAKVAPGEVRAWAAANGMEVSSRGRIPADVMEAYLATN